MENENNILNIEQNIELYDLTKHYNDLLGKVIGNHIYALLESYTGTLDEFSAAHPEYGPWISGIIVDSKWLPKELKATAKETKAKAETKPESTIPAPMENLESTFKNLDAIIDGIKDQAKTGSCKTCQWCIPHGDLSEYHRTHLCAIQGSVNPIDFNKAALDSDVPYPCGPCDDGNWSEEDDKGIKALIPYCMAFKPKTIDGTQYCDESVQKHWKFMSALAEAARLRNAFTDVEKGKLNDTMKVINEFNGGK